MALEIISETAGIYRVGECDVPCLSGVTVVPISLLEEYYPGGRNSFIEVSGVSQHTTERDGFLFMASGSFGYGIGNIDKPLETAHFVRGKDFVHIMVGDSACGWYRGTKSNQKGGLEIGLDPIVVEPSEHLHWNSEPGRMALISKIADADDSAECKFAHLTALLRDAPPGAGKRIAKAVEEAMFKSAADPQVLLGHLHHEHAPVREAIATVIGRMLTTRGQSRRGDLNACLQTLTRDPDTWVRMKAELALGGLQSTRSLSPLGNACFGLHLALEQGWPRQEINLRQSAIRNLFLDKIRRKIKVPQPGTIDWLKNQDLVARHIAVTTGRAPESHLRYALDREPGWKGDELFVSALQWFVSDNYRASFGVWPGRAAVAFAVFDDTKGFDEQGELLRVWRGEFSSPSAARAAIESLPRHVGFRGYDLASPWKVIHQEG